MLSQPCCPCWLSPAVRACLHFSAILPLTQWNGIFSAESASCWECLPPQNSITWYKLHGLNPVQKGCFIARPTTKTKYPLQMTLCHQIQGACMVSSDPLGTSILGATSWLLQGSPQLQKVHSLYKPMNPPEVLFPWAAHATLEVWTIQQTRTTTFLLNCETSHANWTHGGHKARTR